jgi:hypothetical protein
MQAQRNTPVDDVPLRILWNLQAFTGRARPILEAYKDGVYFEHAVTLNGQYVGMIQSINGQWKMDAPMIPQGLVESIGNALISWYG